MTGKLGWTLYESEVVGSGGTARLSLSFVERSSTSSDGHYSPAQSVEANLYSVEEIEKFVADLNTQKEILREKKDVKLPF